MKRRFAIGLNSGEAEYLQEITHAQARKLFRAFISIHREWLKGSGAIKERDFVDIVDAAMTDRRIPPKDIPGKHKNTDPDLVVRVYLTTGSLTKTGEIFDVHRETVRDIVTRRGVQVPLNVEDLSAGIASLTAHGGTERGRRDNQDRAKVRKASEALKHSTEAKRVEQVAIRKADGTVRDVATGKEVEDS